MELLSNQSSEQSVRAHSPCIWLLYLPHALSNIEKCISAPPPLECFKENQISNGKEIYQTLLPEIEI